MKQRLTDENLLRLDLLEPINKAWRAIEEQATIDSRNRWFGPKAFICCPLFGRDLRLARVHTRNDGPVSQPSFKEWSEVPLPGDLQ